MINLLTLLIFLISIINLVVLDPLTTRREDDSEPEKMILFDGYIWQKDGHLKNICAQQVGHLYLIRFLDYSLKFNAYVAVCLGISNGEKIRIEKIDPNQTTGLMANNVQLMPENQHIYGYSLDQLNGLLYYTDGKGIYVADLRKQSLARFNIYNQPFVQQLTTIVSIIVRPLVAQLIWLECFNDELGCEVKQAWQNGQHSETLINTNDTKFSEIIYDEQEDLYILLKQAVDFDRSVRIFDGKKLDVPNEYLDIKILNSDIFHIRNIEFYQKSLIFSASNQSLWKINISENIDSLRSGTGTLRHIVFSEVSWESVEENFRIEKFEKPRSIFFIIFDPNSRINSDEDDENIVCQFHICARSEKDFCLPINQTHSQCTSGEVFTANHGITDRFLIILTFGILLSLILLILLVYCLFFSKQKTRFYPIRLKRLNRVESSKLQVKPPAMEEIAD